VLQLVSLKQKIYIQEISFFILTFSIKVSCHAENSPTCGERPFSNSLMNKIVNGYESAVGDW